METFLNKKLVISFTSISPGYRTNFRMFFFFIFLGFTFSACRKHNSLPFNGNASAYSSEVIDKWMTLQIRLERDATGIPNVAFERYYAYSGIAAFEALAPGTTFSNSTSGKWNGLTGLPAVDNSKSYYWPASVNASLASMNRNIFTAAGAADTAAIDSLESALNTAYVAAVDTEVVGRSNTFGKAVASAVFNWSETDGYKNDGNPYTLPVGAGIWVPTPPAFAHASTPYFGSNRPIIAGSIDNTQPGAPIAYSEDPQSAFYQMVKHVYDVSQTLTPDQTAQGIFWRDVPGVSTSGHWLSILQQVLKQTNASLDKAAYAYAIAGVCQSDASISCFQAKYKYLQVRPITYIRSVLGFSTWNSLLTTPAHPEYPAAHAVISGATAGALTALFGNIGSFTDHTYDYLNYAPRTFSSLRSIGEDAANSRVFAGLHYQPSADTGLIQGRKVTANILDRLGVH